MAKSKTKHNRSVGILCDSLLLAGVVAVAIYVWREFQSQMEEFSGIEERLATLNEKQAALESSISRLADELSQQQKDTGELANVAATTAPAGTRRKASTKKSEPAEAESAPKKRTKRSTSTES